MRTGAVLAFVLAFSSLSFQALSQSTELAPGYYVVVGVYADTKEDVARKYVEDLKPQYADARYGFNSKRRVYLVYLNYYTSLKESLRGMNESRKKEAFKDAWVRVIAGDIGAAQPNPVAAQQPAKTTPAQSAATPAQTTPATNTVPEKEPINPADTVVVTDNDPIVQHNPMTLGNTEVFLSLYNARNNRIVDGVVQVIDTERAKPLAKVKGNEYLILQDPKSKSGQLTLICEAFGYRKIQQEINYPLPLADTVKPYIDLMGTTIVINFDLVRYHTGDITTLYNVYFYNDAAVMMPESKYEVNSLLQLMQENPRYKIRLHGHTNGNYNGKIVSLGPNKNFFSLDGSTQGMGSAKDLSYKRAEVIKEYLVANGIGAERVDVKAWAGKRPLYDKRSANAKKNVRVEVEILEE